MSSEVSHELEPNEIESESLNDDIDLLAGFRLQNLSESHRLELKEIADYLGQDETSNDIDA